MICLGNICRSPLAEGILKAKTLDKNWEIDSAGTSAYHAGEAPDSRSIAVAQKYGIDISNQRSRQLSLADLDYYDKLLVMDSSNYNNVRKICKKKEQIQKIELIMNFVSPPRNTPVPDPYWGNDGFENVYQMLDRACTALVESVEK